LKSVVTITALLLRVKNIVSTTSRQQVRLLCPWGKQFTGLPLSFSV